MSSSPKPETDLRPPSEKPPSPSLQPHDPFSTAPLDLGPPVESLPGANEALTNLPESFSLPATAHDIVDLTMDSDNDVRSHSAPTTTLIKSESQEDALVTGAPSHQAVASRPSEANAILNSIENTSDNSSEKLRDALSTYMANMEGVHAINGDFTDLDDGDGANRAAIDSDQEDSIVAGNFQRLKRQYRAKQRTGRATSIDDVEFIKAKNAEDERVQLREDRQAYDEAEKEKSFFIPEGPMSASEDDEPGEEIPPLYDPAKMAAKKRIVTHFGVDDDDAELESDQDPPRRRSRKLGPLNSRKKSDTTTRRKTTQDRVTKPRDGTAASRGGARGRGRGATRRNRRGIELADTDALFQHNIIEQAISNQDKGSQAVFKSKNKQNALRELVASIPEEHRNLHHGDKVDLQKATRMFNGVGSMRSDGQGGWRLKGMHTSLKSYQLLGAAFLRKREAKTAKPRGGFLSDEMGLGKTCMMIANIVDGRERLPNKPKTTTLIVVPPSLMTQWRHEFHKHATAEALPDVVIYRSGQWMISNNPVRTITMNDVVITSYFEVLKSMPKNEPPMHLVTEKARLEWWEKYYEEKKGLLHQVQWHRVVLDEAQAIKNHSSFTAQAVTALKAKYRWIVSGTPVMNGLAEFYSFFKFIRYPDTGSFELFKRNFCKNGSAAALQRLQVVLSKIMCRRTHLNQLFGKPILVLPPIKPLETIEVEFNPVEAAIYQIVRNRFVNKIQTMVADDQAKDKSYRTILALFTRLRQLVSSPLLIQKTLKELLLTEDLERLWALTNQGGSNGNNDGAADTANALQLALTTVAQADPTVSGRSPDDVSPEEFTPLIQIPTAPGSLGSQFRKYLQSLHDDGQWAKANDRSLCHACGILPVRPQITSCLHVYCNACLQDLKYEAAGNDEDDATCRACGARIKKSEALPAKAFDEAADLQSSPVPSRSPVRKGKKKDEAEEGIDWFTLGGPVLQSAKTKGAVKKMEEWWEADKDAKIIIFVQFRGMIKIFSRICRERGWGYEFFHGEMKFEARDLAIQNFSTDKKCKVLIASLKCGGTGLNLVAANRVIIIDLWFNHCVEAQAFCRVFRIGQTRDVEVARFVAADTIDMEILAMQKKKTEQIDAAMEEKNRPVRVTTKELLKLFGPMVSPEDGQAESEGEEESFIMVDDRFEEQDAQMGGT